MLAPWAREEGLDLTVEELLLRYATSDNEPAIEREAPTALDPTSSPPPSAEPEPRSVAA